MKILVINAGSSSIKYQLFDMDKKAVLTVGLIERIGLASGCVTHTVFRDGAAQKMTREVTVPDHRQGLKLLADLLVDPTFGIIKDPSEIDAVGHRVVHGGERFSKTVVITPEVIAAIKDLIPLAPLHNPANLKGIQVAMEIFSSAVQVAVFDTAFHSSMPARAYRYAIPNDYYRQHGIRVYGFHGTSHLYVSKAAARYLHKPLAATNLITAHLGNGASITAVRKGKSIDTSMGFSPLPGLMMGTRSGDIDPAVVFYLHDKLGMAVPEIDRILNKESGLLGVGGSNDLRDVLQRHEQGDANAELALNMYTYRIKKYIGAYMAALGRLDALVFTAGVGENSAYVRWHACQGLEHLGIKLDAHRNDARVDGITEIQADDSPIKVLVIPTDEELEIATQTHAVLVAAASAVR